MNRQRFITRDPSEEGEIRAQQLGAALAQQCDPEFLEAVLHMKSALDEFGGQAYIAAARDRFDDQGNPVQSGGRFYTWGYILHYGSKVTIRRLETEEEVHEEGPPPEADVEQPTEDVPEPVEA